MDPIDKLLQSIAPPAGRSKLGRTVMPPAPTADRSADRSTDPNSTDPSSADPNTDPNTALGFDPNTDPTADPKANPNAAPSPGPQAKTPIAGNAADRSGDSGSRFNATGRSGMTHTDANSPAPSGPQAQPPTSSPAPAGQSPPGAPHSIDDLLSHLPGSHGPAPSGKSPRDPLAEFKQANAQPPSTQQTDRKSVV